MTAEDRKGVASIARMRRGNEWRYPIAYIAALYNVSRSEVYRVSGPRRVTGIKISSRSPKR
jgi:hypothetical protein